MITGAYHFCSPTLHCTGTILELCILLLFCILQGVHYSATCEVMLQNGSTMLRLSQEALNIRAQQLKVEGSLQLLKIMQESIRPFLSLADLDKPP